MENTIIVHYDPRKEQPRPRKGNREFNVPVYGDKKDKSKITGNRIYTLVSGKNYLNDDAIAQLEKIDTWEQLKNCEAIAYDKKVVVDPEKSTEKPKQTVEQRTKDLESLFEQQGYKPIEALAKAMGITEKPEGGWKETIPSIVNHELNKELIVK